ncbi:MAG: hypothetical protein AAFR22_10895, partial [Chloroflexota bacterium]
MAFQYESLVGHLFVVNGRTLASPPPGALIEVAPKNASRGREADTLYVLVLPSGQPAASLFYEQLAEMAAERYFNSSGSVTAGLRAMYDLINRNLLDHNKAGGRVYEVNMMCAVLHDRNLILSRCGLGMAVLKNGDQTLYFPTDPLNETDVVFGPPLGVQGLPDVRLKQFRVQPGARLVMADADLADADRAEVAAAMTADDVSAMLMQMKNLLVRQITAIGVELISPEEPEDPFMPEGSNSKRVLESPLPEEKQVDRVDIAPGAGTQLIDTITDTRDRAQIGMSAAAKGVARGAEVTNGLIDHYLSEEDDSERWWSGPLGIAAAISIPVLVVGLVIVMWLLNIGQSEYEACVSQAFDTATLARGISSSDPNGTLSAWNAVLLKVNECDTLRPEGIPDQPMRDLQREGQTVVDTLLNIDRREAIPVASFPSAQLSQVILRGLTMYTLDDNNDIVYKIELTGDGRSLAPNTMEPIPNMRRGAPVQQFTVDDIIDIAWAEDGSALSQGNVLIALDANGVLVEHSPTILVRGVQRLLGTENWVAPVAIQVWRGNLYVLDPGANQIWRYSPTGGSYQGAPTEYFAGQGRPNITRAVDFAIDENGVVYLLYGDGNMGKYRSGENENFDFTMFPPGQEMGTSTQFHFSTSPISQYMYITSQPNRTVYKVTHAGTFVRSYRTF